MRLEEVQYRCDNGQIMKGHASALLDRLIEQCIDNLATPGQLRWLGKLGILTPTIVSFDCKQVRSCPPRYLKPGLTLCQSPTIQGSSASCSTSCPTAHNGVHPWLFRIGPLSAPVSFAGRNLLHFGDSAWLIAGVPLKPHEIVDAVKNSAARQMGTDRQKSSERRAEWLGYPTRQGNVVPEFNPELPSGPRPGYPKTSRQPG